MLWLPVGFIKQWCWSHMAEAWLEALTGQSQPGQHAGHPERAFLVFICRMPRPRPTCGGACQQLTSVDFSSMLLSVTHAYEVYLSKPSTNPMYAALHRLPQQQPEEVAGGSSSRMGQDADPDGSRAQLAAEGR